LVLTGLQACEISLSPAISGVNGDGNSEEGGGGSQEVDETIESDSSGFPLKADSYYTILYQFKNDLTDSLEGEIDGEEGDIANPVSYAYDSDRNGTVLSLDGNSFAFVNDPAAYRWGHGNFVVAFWFKTSSLDEMYLFDTGYIGASTTRDLVYSKINNGEVYATFSTDWGGACRTELYSGGDYADGEWHHYAFVRDNKRTGKLYIDGVVVDEDIVNTGCSAGGADPNKGLWIGSSWSETNKFVGLIDNFFMSRFTWDDQSLFYDQDDVQWLKNNY